MLKTKLLIVGVIAAVVGVNFAGEFVESFDSNPLQNGWNYHGNSNLFFWDSSGKNLKVTWDSSNPNSYFYKPLGVTLDRKSVV